MPPKAKKSKVPQKPHGLTVPGKSVPHGEEFDVPFIPWPTVIVPPPALHPETSNLNEAVLLNRVVELEAAHVELAADVVRIVDLIVKGDIDSAKFKGILSKRQGKA